ncbi:FkbM family methyltransferase [Sphingopyxis sp.]|uniref:FkbM family methyltransferase n=1 Tax=Sphingopyxis sp. TaxID=1908224 RepID=UPI003BADB2A0
MQSAGRPDHVASPSKRARYSRRMSVKSLLRAAQSSAPWIRPLKFEAYNFATRTFGWHIEPEFHLLSRIGDVSLALDVGGNWGQSIEALKRTIPGARIISFEPNPLLAGRLDEKFAGDAAVTVERYALAVTAGRFTLYIPTYRGYIYDGLASLSREEAENWFTRERFAGFDPTKLTIDAVDVETRTLDSLGFAPDVIKVDVQGAESLMVQGGARTLETCRPTVIMEAPDEALVDRLGRIGLNAYYYDGNALLDWRKNTNNVIFLSEEHRFRVGL